MSIDAFRVVANFVIIVVHTGPFMGTQFPDDAQFFGELINQFVRVATPFFFLAAGYFFAASLSRGAEPLPLAARLIKRLVYFFLFWSLVYILLPLDIWLRPPGTTYFGAVHAALIRSLTPRVLFTGSRFHLWFLPALAAGLALLATAARVHREKTLLAGAAFLYGAGLLAGAYKATPIGLDFGINTRNGPFLSTIFVVSGYLFYRTRLNGTLLQMWLLIAAGIGVRIAEVLWISAHSPTKPSQMEYLLGTYPFGLGIFLLVLNSERLGRIKWMVRVSRYSPGIYCAHMLFVDYFSCRPLALGNSLWEIARPMVILVLSIALVAAMSKVRPLRSVMT